MSDSIRPATGKAASVQNNQAGPMTRFARSAVLRRLKRLADGQLMLIENGTRMMFGCESSTKPAVALTVHRPGFFRRVLAGGVLGAAEAYFDGDWECDDLPGLVRLLIRNEAVLRGVEGPASWPVRAMARVWHALRRNTTRGSRANIAAHYDLGNAFYRLFLDETMTYSAAVWPSEEATFEEAQLNKIDRLADRLDVQRGDHVLEIGTGWGSTAVHLASTRGCRVTTTTISKKQFAVAAERIHEADLDGRVTLLLKDYRDLDGRFDKLISIEMIEAVGANYLGRFLRKCAALLKPTGAMALQAITIAEQRYAEHVRKADFIKRYIFPGSCLLSITRLGDQATRKTDLRLSWLEEITPHYARTLHLWRERFLERIDEVKSQGFDERFCRLWEFYLAYCEGAFAERYIGDVQMLWTKPAWRFSTQSITNGLNE